MKALFRWAFPAIETMKKRPIISSNFRTINEYFGKYTKKCRNGLLFKSLKNVKARLLLRNSWYQEANKQKIVVTIKK